MGDYNRHNEGEVLKHQLQEDGQRNWGFVIYRCTYGNDNLWNYFMKVINERVRASLDFYETPELMKTLDWRVEEDRAFLDGASKDQVRQHFRHWIVTNTAAGRKERLAPRYNYCVHVDKESLESVIKYAPQPPDADLAPIGYVNIISANWTFEEDEDEDEIEGCTQNDVGWMKAPVDGLAPGFYSMLGESGGWEICYVRPPGIAEP
ncbi:hypothetical protein MMC12_000691 [Toensbergia leucococca]|nr:hypothetical protein [Toensbergia leucococca]